MGGRKGASIARPTIAEVLQEFLADQRPRLSARTFARYEDVVALLQQSLNGYAYQALGKAESALFDRLYSAEGPEHREFCEILGSEHILPNVEEFLDYFMVRKVMAGKDLLRAAGTVTRKLARWLEAKGYVEPEDAADAADRGGAAARDLPKASELASLLSDFADGQAPRGKNRIEDHFRIIRVEPGRLWLEGMIEAQAIGPIRVPHEISDRCRVGWSISGAVTRAGRTWKILEAWNVYPG